MRIGRFFAVYLGLAAALTVGLAVFQPVAADGPGWTDRSGLDRTRVAAGAAVFQLHCRRCHHISAAQPGYGPALSGVVGRPAGTLADFRYSDGLTATGVIWTRSSLRALLDTGPALIEGLRCVGRPHLDPLRQEVLIDYLETTSKGAPPHNI